eukprot:699557-Pyramimonas_sp.AAC.1
MKAREEEEKEEEEDSASPRPSNDVARNPPPKFPFSPVPTVGELKKEPFSLGRGSVSRHCLTACLRCSLGSRWAIEVELMEKRGPRSLFGVP